MNRDVALVGGTLIDASGASKVEDVVVRRGRIATATQRPEPEIDVSGLMVVPGLLDIHGHYYHSGHPAGTVADVACLPTGVTTAVDGGSAGWANFGAFSRGPMSVAAVNLYAFLNLSGSGLLTPLVNGVGELQDLSSIDIDKTIQCIEQAPHSIIGVKVRVDRQACGDNALSVLRLARHIAEVTRTRVMVHVTNSPIPLATILEALVPGDIVTHVFHSESNGILDASGDVIEEARTAQRQGVIFDVGYGAVPSSHFAHSVAAAAIRQEFVPDTLSTDCILAPPNRSVPNLLHVMEVFLSLGMTLSGVISAVTTRPAEAIGKADLHGSLSEGSQADLAVLAYNDEEKKLSCCLTMRAGAIYWRTLDDAFNPKHS